MAEILIAINPNRIISDLYSDKTRHAYEIEEITTPHVYAVGNVWLIEIFVLAGPYEKKF